MRFVRFMWQGKPACGMLAGDQVVPVADRPWERLWAMGTALAFDPEKLLAPVVPGKIVAVGRNYRAHAAELGNPVPASPIIFLKPPSAVIGPGAAIVYPPSSENVQHEAEVAAVIGRRCHRASAAEALSYVWGYTCANDVTARDLQRKDEQWTRGKGFDTFCPLGPWVETELPDPQRVRITCRVNGQMRQDGDTADMIFPVAELISFISHVMTLEPGDVVLTGTPEGVGQLQSGDVVEVEGSGIGTLRNVVESEA